jgi:hypothetical protein
MCTAYVFCVCVLRHTRAGSTHEFRSRGLNDNVRSTGGGCRRTWIGTEPDTVQTRRHMHTLRRLKRGYSQMHSRLASTWVIDRSTLSCLSRPKELNSQGMRERASTLPRHFIHPRHAPLMLYLCPQEVSRFWTVLRLLPSCTAREWELTTQLRKILLPSGDLQPVTLRGLVIGRR